MPDIKQVPEPQKLPSDEQIIQADGSIPTFANNAKIIKTDDCVFIDFRSITPVVLQAKANEPIHLDLRDFPPHTRIVMPINELKTLYKELGRILTEG